MAGVNFEFILDNLSNWGLYSVSDLVILHHEQATTHDETDLFLLLMIARGHLPEVGDTVGSIRSKSPPPAWFGWRWKKVLRQGSEQGRWNA